MNPSDESLWVGYFSIVFTVLWTALFFEGSVVVGYLLVGAFFAYSIALGYFDRLSEPQMAIILTVNAVTILLIVIDPAEIGFYGHDSYAAYNDYLAFRSRGLDGVISRDAWPSFPILVSLIFELIGTDSIAVAKYIPFLSVAAPLLLFITARRLSDITTAYYSGMAFIAFRRFTLFQSKFVDQTVAVILLFLVMYALLREDSKTMFGVIGLVSVPVFILSQQFIPLVAVGVISIWWTVTQASTWQILPDRIRPIARSPSVGGYALVFGIGVVSMYIWIAVGFTRRLLVGVIIELRGSKGPPDPTGNLQLISGDASIRELIASSALIFLLVFALILMAAFFSHRRQADWEVGFTISAGIFSIAYVLGLIAGRILWLNPIRILIIIVPLLIPVAIHTLRENPSKHKRILRTTAVALVFGFVVTQVAAIPPHVLYTNSTSTTVEQGHFTPGQFQASSWMSEYRREESPILAYEPALWRAEQNEDLLRHLVHESRCGHHRYHTERPEGYHATSNLSYSNQIYDSRIITVKYC